jgi:hypothetical protein
MGKDMPTVFGHKIAETTSGLEALNLFRTKSGPVLPCDHRHDHAGYDRC